MFQLHTLLLATDFSPPSLEAAKTAVQLAHIFGSTVHVVHVVEQLAGYTNIRITATSVVPPLLRIFVDAAYEELNNFVKTYVDGLPETQYHLRVGRPYQEIVRAAQSSDADLVVIGTSGRSGVARMLLGSVAEKVIVSSSVPVLSLRTAPRLAPQPRLVVATDLSESSKQAARIADGFAQGLDGIVSLLSVLEPPNQPAFWKMQPAESVSHAQARLLEQLQEVAQQCIHASPSPQLLIRAGAAQEEILSAIAALPADLLFIGVSGRSKISQWLMGGVTRRVLQTSPVAIVTARAG